MFPTAIDFARDQDKWPAWPVLPVKRGDYFNEPDGLGYLFAGTPVQPVVYIGNIFAADPANDKPIVYGSLEELFGDGWRID
jgi:hypothetical protein